jgi:hypothetical protein
MMHEYMEARGEEDKKDRESPLENWLWICSSLVLNGEEDDYI